MRINVYLNFNGCCEAAFDAYAALLGGEITLKMTFAGSPMAAHAPADFGSKILHATLKLGDQILQGSDATPDRFQPSRGFFTSLSFPTLAEAEAVYAGLSEGAQIEMPLQSTFWSPGFAMLTDRFGTPWMINVDPDA